MTGITEFPPNLISQLLATDDTTTHARLLQEAGLLTADGLLRLLDVAQRMAGDDPEMTHALVRRCRQQIAAAAAPHIMPRAHYLEAYVHAMRGDFAMALPLLDQARDEYLALGLTLDAASVNVGLSNILIETGELQQALATCRQILAAIGQAEATVTEMGTVDATVAEANDGEPDTVESHPPASAQVMLLAAKAQQNLGICYERLGEYSAALAAYTPAATAYRRLAMLPEQADILVNRGLVLQQLGRMADALTTFEAAEAIYATQQLRLFQAEALINIGETRLLLSNYVQSINALEEAHRLLDALDELSTHAILLRHMGDAYLALNLHAEALDAYQKALPHLKSNGLRHDHAHVLWGMGIVLAGHQPEQALARLTAAATLFQTMGNVRLQSAVALEQTTLLEQLERREEAQALAAQVWTAVETTDWVMQQIYALMRIADLAATPALALAHLQQAAALVQPLALPQLQYRLDARLGQRYLQQKDWQAAQTHLERAVAEIQRLRNTLVQERMRASFLADKLLAFETLVRLHLDQGQWDAAFAVAEQAKSRALVDLLSGVIDARSVMGNAAEIDAEVDAENNTEKNARLQQLRAELDAVYNQLLNNDAPARATPADNSTADGSTGERSPTVDPTPDNDAADHLRGGAPQVLAARATEIERELSRLTLRTGRNAHVHSKQLSAAVPTATLPIPAEQTLLVYHIVDTEIVAFVYSEGSVQVVRNLCTVAVVQELVQRLAVQWERFRVGTAFIERHMALLERSTQRILHDLYHYLIAPLLPLLEADINRVTNANNGGAPALTIVPHGLLHQLPFHALYDGTTYLLEQYAIAYAPSATVFALCQQRRMGDGHALILGTADQDIPIATQEVANVAHLLRTQGTDAQALTAAQATRAAFLAGAPGCRVLHMACHGIFRSDNPLFSALKLHDGWLTAADAIQLRLDGAMVVLSACESGRSQVIGGDEILGLTYAMLSAGASSLLVSQWLAQDETTARLMEAWYTALGERADPANALRTAQLHIKNDHPHPFHWAPFILIGQRQSSHSN